MKLALATNYNQKAAYTALITMNTVETGCWNRMPKSRAYQGWTKFPSSIPVGNPLGLLLLVLTAWLPNPRPKSVPDTQSPLLLHW